MKLGRGLLLVGATSGLTFWAVHTDDTVLLQEFGGVKQQFGDLEGKVDDLGRKVNTLGREVTDGFSGIRKNPGLSLFGPARCFTASNTSK